MCKRPRSPAFGPQFPSRTSRSDFQRRGKPSLPQMASCACTSKEQGKHPANTYCKNETTILQGLMTKPAIGLSGKALDDVDDSSHPYHLNFEHYTDTCLVSPTSHNTKGLRLLLRDSHEVKVQHSLYGAVLHAINDGSRLCCSSHLRKQVGLHMFFCVAPVFAKSLLSGYNFLASPLCKLLDERFI